MFSTIYRHSTKFDWFLLLIQLLCVSFVPTAIIPWFGLWLQSGVLITTSLLRFVGRYPPTDLGSLWYCVAWYYYHALTWPLILWRLRKVLN